MIKLIVGRKYKWKHENVILEYIGNTGGWNRFALAGSDKVYCEVLDSDLHLMECVFFSGDKIVFPALSNSVLDYDESLKMFISQGLIRHAEDSEILVDFHL